MCERVSDTKVRATASTTGRQAEVVLRFKNGLVVRPKDCPRGISAFPHWRHDADGGEYGICLCVLQSGSARP